MRFRRANWTSLLPWLAAFLLPAASAADPEAGKARAQAVCAACHGANGISVADSIPNLAGQRVPYLESQLKAFKSGARKVPVMNAMAAQLGADDIASLAAYFGSLAPASGGSKSALLPALAMSKVQFPEGYQGSFTMYQTVNRADIGQVRYLWANPVALQAAREGRSLPDGSVLLLEQHSVKRDGAKQPVTGADGNFERDSLLGYTVMERSAGWGKDFPEMLRNEDWQYAAFSAAKQQRTGVNQADCLACHKPLDKMSYAFSIEQIKVAALKR